MKATLDGCGTLRILAESDVEAFALSHWHTLWNEKQVTLLIETVERSKTDGFLERTLTLVSESL